ncbi:MAG: ABC transporter permease [Brevinematales bacterium]|jgi:lipoprotein-releasing system permease protein
MDIILYLSTKYLKFKASDRGLSVISVIALLTIVISCAAAIVILSAANGIHDNFMQKLMARDFHAVIMGPGRGISHYDMIKRRISKIKGVTEVFPFYEKQALLKGSFSVWGAMIVGMPVDIFENDRDFRKQFKLNDGDFSFKNKNSISIGYNLAINLGVGVGDTIGLMVYGDDFIPTEFRFRVGSVFTAGQKDYDTSLAFISFDDAREIFSAGNYADGLRVKVEDPYDIEKYLPQLRSAAPYYIYSWKDLHRNDLAALQDEKMLINIILFFFFFVVAFNILSTMIAMVLDKKEEIGILKAMGLKPSGTLQVFLFDGFLLGVGGSLVGIVTGLLITVTLNDILKLVEITINFVLTSGYYLARLAAPVAPPAMFQFFNSNVYYIDKFPIKILFGDILFVMILSVSLSTIAVILPALNASRMRPVEVLRND